MRRLSWQLHKGWQELCCMLSVGRQVHAQCTMHLFAQPGLLSVHWTWTCAAAAGWVPFQAGVASPGLAKSQPGPRQDKSRSIMHLAATHARFAFPKDPARPRHPVAITYLHTIPMYYAEPGYFTHTQLSSSLASIARG